jgi:hypothetical protein
LRLSLSVPPGLKLAKTQTIDNAMFISFWDVVGMIGYICGMMFEWCGMLLT